MFRKAGTQITSSSSEHRSRIEETTKRTHQGKATRKETEEGPGFRGEANFREREVLPCQRTVFITAHRGRTIFDPCSACFRATWPSIWGPPTRWCMRAAKALW